MEVSCLSSCVISTHKYSADAMTWTLALACAQKRWTHRTIEAIQYSNDGCRRQVTVDLSLPSYGSTRRRTADDEPVAVPLFFAERGRLIDNLDVSDNSGRSLPVLCHSEHEKFSGLLLKRLAIHSVDKRARTDTEFAEDAITWIAALERIPNQPPDVAQDIISNFINEEEGSVDLQKMRANPVLRTFAISLSKNYPIFAEAKAHGGSRLLLKYSYDWDVKAVFRHYPSRLIFGASPTSFLIPMVIHRATESYHLRMAAPPGHFVYQQRFLIRNTGRSFDTCWKEVDFPQEVLTSGHGKVGAPYAHLYVGGKQKDALPVEMYARFVFHEKPPGAMGVALVIALVVAVSYFLMAAYFDILLSEKYPQVAPLVLALPGTAALWLRRVVPNVDSLTIPLSANLTLVGSSLTVYAVSLFLTIAQGSRRGLLVDLFPVILAIFSLVFLAMAYVLAVRIRSNFSHIRSPERSAANSSNGAATPFLNDARR